MTLKPPPVAPLEPRPEPTAAEITEGYRQFAGEEVDLWHFAMMNDEVRNSAYENALRGALKNGGTVLDIGTGSGLLSMLAIRQGATDVITCEAVPMIARKAKEIITKNGFAGRVQIINRRSTGLIVGKDFKERADVLVTEIFDDGLLGEGAFVAIGHATEHLLKPNAQLIPAGVRVMAMAIESDEIFQNHRVTEAAGFDVSAFNEFSVKGYMGYHLDKMNYRALTAPQCIFEFDFKNLPGCEEKPLDFEVSASGLCHAVAYWYELKLDEVTTIKTGPGLPRLSSWKQAVILLDTPRPLSQGKKFSLIAHHNTEAIWFSSP